MPHVFFERLHQELDQNGLPQDEKGRMEAFAKIFNFKQMQCKSILYGNVPPAPDVIEQIAEEFELDAKWLAGQDQ